ncbi:enoyl-CoA hydratase [Herbihabitans rhizosphaerae]|uniref:Enoyl-CoA hydratase n=1 Tax=Herbihabitans rhizosphaerae TaxID=1872711 RepID=A0A4Q7KVL3_9PSEU|nr:enoyl-CoA hydratase [Herbihabitans rhizosphaerae]RZS40754.1 enoyl-CoA hydratase [Herbihabitans rhizosphaerae]
MCAVLVERTGKVAVITLNVPDRRNALTLPISAELADAVDACEADENTHAIVVTGAPPAFCAGADLTALGDAREEGLRAIYKGFLAIADCTLPTIAAVGGAAVGAGLNLALACDLRLAGPRARFDARFLQLGLHPGGGMTWMLQRIVGPQTATAMTLFGQKMDADEAVRTGLAHRKVDGEHEDLVRAAVELATPSAEAPRELVLSTKRTLRTTSATADHPSAIETELIAQLASMDTPAFAQLIAAMQEKISRKA